MHLEPYNVKPSQYLARVQMVGGTCGKVYIGCELIGATHL